MLSHVFCICCYRNIITYTFCYRSLINFTNNSAVHKAIDLIIAFGDNVNSINEAGAAANKAKKAADHALAVSTAAQNYFSIISIISLLNYFCQITIEVKPFILFSMDRM